MIDTRETLEQQHDENEKWDHDLLIHTVLELLKGPLNERTYRSLSVEDAREEISAGVGVIKGTSYDRRIKRLLKKIYSLETTREIILHLGEVICGD